MSEVKTMPDRPYVATVKHKISGAPLIERMLEQRQAVCVCVFAVPITGYRRLHVAEHNQKEHEVEWDKNWVGQPPYFHPFIACCENVSFILKEKDGVHFAWVGKQVEFRKGAKIALGPIWNLKSSLQSLLCVKSDSELGSGQMRVESCEEDGFYFNVFVAEDLYSFLIKPEEEQDRRQARSIFIHAVSSCFLILKQDYGDEDEWKAHASLVTLTAEMEDKGIALWSDPEFHPEEAATKMYPHQVRNAEDV